jgi:hypothetical protein
MIHQRESILVINRDLLDSLPLIYRALANVLQRDGSLIIQDNSMYSRRIE